jgi:hypothetical protein
VRGVERKGARRHLRHADATEGAGEAAREQPVATVVGVDDDDVFGEIERDLDRLGEPPLDSGLEHHPVDDHVDRVVAAAIEFEVLIERPELAVDADLGEPLRPEREQFLLELTLAAADHRREHVDPLLGWGQQHHVDDPLERLRGDLAPAQMAMRHADVGEQQAEIIVDFGDGTDRRARVRPGGLLLDGDRRGKPVDQVDVGLLHLFEELARVGGERLDVPPLPFGINRIEGERGFAGPRQPGQYDQRVAGDIDVDVLEVVDPCSTHGNPVVGHSSQEEIPGKRKTSMLALEPAN